LVCSECGDIKYKVHFFVACAAPAGQGVILSRSSFQPDGLEVRLIAEVGGHVGVVGAQRALRAAAQLLLEIVEAEIAAIRRTQQPAARSKDVDRELGEFAEVFFDAEDLAFFVA
jgi:hypothetical protein